MEEIVDAKEGFMDHVFQFNENGKAEMWNVAQYSIISLLPTGIVIQLLKNWVPAADPDKSTTEIVVEIAAQIVTIFFGIMYINRIVTYFPTYSGKPYADFSVTTTILAVLVCLMSLQTKLGEKVNILVERATDYWNGTGTGTAEPTTGKSRTIQPLQQPCMPGTTPIDQLPYYEHTQVQTPQMAMPPPVPVPANSVGAFGSPFK